MDSKNTAEFELPMTVDFTTSLRLYDDFTMTKYNAKNKINKAKAVKRHFSILAFTSEPL